MTFTTLQLSTRVPICTVDHLLWVYWVVQLCDLIVPRRICSLQMCWRFRHLRRLLGLGAGKKLPQFPVIWGVGVDQESGLIMVMVVGRTLEAVEALYGNLFRICIPSFLLIFFSFLPFLPLRLVGVTRDSWGWAWTAWRRPGATSALESTLRIHSGDWTIIKNIPSDSEPEAPDVTPVPVPLSQVAPGVLWSPRVWGDKERTCVPHRRLLVLCRVFRHHCCFCLLVLPRGHHRLHLPSEQVPREQPGAAHCECGGLLDHCRSALTLLWWCGGVLCSPGLCGDCRLLLHVAGQLLCLGQGPFWRENGHRPRWGSAPRLGL